MPSYVILIFAGVFIFISIIIKVATKYESKQKSDIKEMWTNKGFFIHEKENSFMGIKSYKTIAIKTFNNYVLVGTNWVVSTGKTTIPYWGIALMTRTGYEIPKFKITKRKPNIFDGKRIRFNDIDLDKMIVAKCKDKEWFQMYFDEGFLRQTAEMLPKSTYIWKTKKIPVSFDGISELTGFQTSPFIIVQRTESLAYSKSVDQVIDVAEQWGKKLGR